MKTLKTIIAAISALVLAGACNKAEVEQEGTLATLDFSLSLPQTATKTIADGMKVNEVVCAVFENGSEIAALRQTIAVENGVVKANYKPSLYIGRKYQLVFWAHHKDYYNVADLKDIKANTIAGNTDYADAFYATADVDFRQAEQTGAATLTRPLSKLNIAVPQEHWNDDAKYTRVTMDVCSSFNAVSGESGASEQVSFTVPVSSETMTVDGTVYRILAYNYLLPGANTNVKIEVSKSAEGDFDAENVILTIEEPNVPVVGNSQTHMVGDIFRGELDFSVSISTGFTTPDEEVEI